MSPPTAIRLLRRTGHRRVPFHFIPLHFGHLPLTHTYHLRTFLTYLPPPRFLARGPRPPTPLAEGHTTSHYCYHSYSSIPCFHASHVLFTHSSGILVDLHSFEPLNLPSGRACLPPPISALPWSARISPLLPALPWTFSLFLHLKGHGGHGHGTPKMSSSPASAWFSATAYAFYRRLHQTCCVSRWLRTFHTRTLPLGFRLHSATRKFPAMGDGCHAAAFHHHAATAFTDAGTLTHVDGRATFHSSLTLPSFADCVHPRCPPTARCSGPHTPTVLPHYMPLPGCLPPPHPTPSPTLQHVYYHTPHTGHHCAAPTHTTHATFPQFPTPPHTHMIPTLVAHYPTFSHHCHTLPHTATHTTHTVPFALLPPYIHSTPTPIHTPTTLPHTPAYTTHAPTFAPHMHTCCGATYYGRLGYIAPGHSADIVVLYKCAGCPNDDAHYRLPSLPSSCRGIRCYPYHRFPTTVRTGLAGTYRMPPIAALLACGGAWPYAPPACRDAACGNAALHALPLRALPPPTAALPSHSTGYSHPQPAPLPPPPPPPRLLRASPSRRWRGLRPPPPCPRPRAPRRTWTPAPRTHTRRTPADFAGRWHPAFAVSLRTRRAARACHPRRWIQRSYIV